MAKIELEKVEINGRIVRMSATALRIAQRHFHARKESQTEKTIPIELLRLPPKVDIIKAEKEPVKIVNAPVLATEKPAEIPAEIPEEKPVVKKQAVRRKK